MNATCSPALAATGDKTLGDLIPTQQAVSREEDEAATGSNCSAFGMSLDPKAISIFDQSTGPSLEVDGLRQSNWAKILPTAILTMA